MARWAAAIRRCTAPCTGKIAPEPYAEDVRNAMLFLEGREDDVINNLNEKMTSASEARRYEEAGVTHILARLTPHDIPSEHAERTVELLGKYVLPEFR